MENPAGIDEGSVITTGPQLFTTGVGAMGKITTLTVLDTHPGLTVPTVLLPQAVASTYRARIE